MVADAITGNISREATTSSGNIFAEAMRTGARIRAADRGAGAPQPPFCNGMVCRLPRAPALRQFAFNNAH